MKTKRFLTKNKLLIVCLAFVLVGCQWNEDASGNGHARTVANIDETIHNVNASDARKVVTVTYGIFGDVRIRSSEYLFNLNDSPDFIYVDFEDYGYVVYLSERDMRPLKPTNHSIIVTIPQKDLRTDQLFDVENGYIRDIYPYNLLNECQLVKLRSTIGDVGELLDVSDHLKLLALTESEIKEIKKMVRFPIMP